MISPAAWAHAALVTVEPPDGAILAQAPAVLKLTFNEPVAPLVMQLIGPSGLPVTPGSVDVDNATILISRLPPLTTGTHVLSWRVTSADGHPVGGSLIFSIGTTTEPPAAAHLADQGVRAALWAGKLALYVGLFVGVGGAFYRAWISDPSPACCGSPGRGLAHRADCGAGNGRGAGPRRARCTVGRLAAEGGLGSGAGHRLRLDCDDCRLRAVRRARSPSRRSRRSLRAPSPRQACSALAWRSRSAAMPPRLLRS